MTAATTKTVVTPTDLDSVYFTQDSASKRFKLVPSGAVSADASNLLTIGTDGKLTVTASAIKSALPSTDIKSIAFANNVLSITQADNVVVNVDLTPLDIHTTGVSLDASGNLVLAQADGAPSLTVSLGAFMKAVLTANSNGVTLAGDGKATALSVSLVVDPIMGNLFKVTASGLKVDPADVVALFTANVTHTLAVDSANGVFRSVVNGVVATTPIVELVDGSGNHVLYGFQ